MMIRRNDIAGCGLFEVFPDNPNQPEADGVQNLAASIARMLDRGRPDSMKRQRYDKGEHMKPALQWDEMAREIEQIHQKRKFVNDVERA